MHPVLGRAARLRLHSVSGGSSGIAPPGIARSEIASREVPPDVPAVWQAEYAPPGENERPAGHNHLLTIGSQVRILPV
jgi:hypothetical protein